MSDLLREPTPIVETSSPVMQRAHELVEQLTPLQLSALVDLLDVVAHESTHSTLLARPLLASFGSGRLGGGEDGAVPSSDSDFWPEPGQRSKTAVAHGRQA